VLVHVLDRGRDDPMTFSLVQNRNSNVGLVAQNVPWLLLMGGPSSPAGSPGPSVGIGLRLAMVNNSDSAWAFAPGLLIGLGLATCSLRR
jgi:hypothetical protein